MFKKFLAAVSAAVLGVSAVSVVGSSAAGSPFVDFSKSYKTISDDLYQFIINLGYDKINYNDVIMREIYGHSGSGGHGGGSYSRYSGISGLYSNAVNDVVNSSGFASDVDSLLVAYAKASTGAGGEPVVTEITVPTQLDFSGQVFCTGSGGYEELFQFHLVYNGYRYTQGFYPDCAIYFDLNG